MDLVISSSKKLPSGNLTQLWKITILCQKTHDFNGYFQQQTVKLPEGRAHDEDGDGDSDGDVDDVGNIGDGHGDVDNDGDGYEAYDDYDDHEGIKQ